jgi:phosphoglycerate dehydrogenase-like enzyme
MPKKTALVLCSPDHYLLRNFKPLEESLNIYTGTTLEELLPHAEEAEILVNSGLSGKSVHMTELWPHMPNLRWVHSLAAGLDKLLFPELVESDVVLTNARGVFKRPLAEFAVLGMLYFYKNVRRMVEAQRRHKWDGFLVEWLRDKVMGIVGYGEIGQECALLAKPLGVKIHATRRNPAKSQDDPLLDRVFPLSDLHSMLQEIDVLVAAAPLTPETHHMISDRELAVMKPGAIVINVGRGPVIDEAALVRALQTEKIRAAALDVFEVEPLPESSPLWDMENVLISPHCTDRTSNPDWLDLSAQLFVDNVRRYLAGQQLENVVDKRAGY